MRSRPEEPTKRSTLLLPAITTPLLLDASMKLPGSSVQTFALGETALIWASSLAA